MDKNYRRYKRDFLNGFKIGIGFLIAVGVTGLFGVAVTGTFNTFSTGGIIKSSEFNSNFATLKSAIESIPDFTKFGAHAVYSSGGLIVNTGIHVNAATLTVNGKISSANLGTYCGNTPATNGNLGGYIAGKALCVAACGNSNAHICTSHEMSISSQLGISITPNIWYSTFNSYAILSNWNPTNDCNGWTIGTSTVNGAIYKGPSPSESLCSAILPVACCL